MALPTKNQPIKAKSQSQSQAPAPKPAAAQQNEAGARIINQTPARALIKEAPVQFPLARRNFIFMIAAGLLIVIGFILMLGPGSTPEKFNPDIFSTRRIVVGPTLAFLGFVFMGIAIIIKPSKKSDTFGRPDTDTDDTKA